MTRWRATELERTTENGRTYPPEPAELAELPTTGDRRIVAKGTETVLLDTAGAVVWRHECGAKPNAAHVSADRVLVLTNSLDYHTWGILGPALLLDLDTGTRLAELRGETGAALDHGWFLLGLEGYGTFETWLHDRAGTLVTTWHSYGHYVVNAGDVRVIECDRSIPTRSAVVRLLPGGGIERGPQLRSGQVGAPVMLPDGTIVVLDGERLLAVGSDLRGQELATIRPVADAAATTTLDWCVEDGILTVSVVSGGTTHRIRYGLTSRSAGPWSRRGG